MFGIHWLGCFTGVLSFLISYLTAEEESELHIFAGYYGARAHNIPFGLGGYWYQTLTF